MRKAFIEELTNQARVNPSIFLVVGDLGYSVVEPFAAEFPDRFLNAGVAEQNMTGVAAGLASEGYHVFTYSIANFPTMRCLEQIRNDICYHRYSVTIVAVGGGLAYGNLGYSHHAVQDLSVLRSMPNMAVLIPCDSIEVEACVKHVIKSKAPSYIRVGKSGEPLVHRQLPPVDRPATILAGSSDTAIVASGPIVKLAIDLCAEDTTGRCPTVLSMPMLKPISRETIGILASFKHVIALEEHVQEGGLFAAIAENINSATRLHHCCLTSQSMDLVGSQEWLREQCGVKELLADLIHQCTQ